MLRRLLLAATITATFVGAPVLLRAQSQSCVSLNHTLALGSSGADVSALQKFFGVAYGNFPAATGYFGPTTEAAVKQWQKEHGIVSSGTPSTTGWGVVGAKTRAAMACSSGILSPTATPAPTLSSASLSSPSGVTQASLSQQLTDLENRLADRIANTPSTVASTVAPDQSAGIADLQTKYASLKASLDALTTAVSNVPAANSDKGGVAACGYRQNFLMTPAPEAKSLAKDLIGPASFVLCDGATWIRLPAVETSTGHVYLNNVGQGGHNTSGLELTLHNRVNVTARGVSTGASQGGIDPGDPKGPTLAPNTNYNVFLVARDPKYSPNDWGLVISSRGCTNGPSATVQAAYPYYTCIDWLRSDESGAALKYQTIKETYRWQVTGAPIVVASGEKARWTQLGLWGLGLPDNTGSFNLIIVSQDEGGFAAVAPNTYFGDTPLCQVRGSAYPHTFQQCTVTPDQGVLGIWSSGANAYWEIIGGLDGY